MTSKPRLSRAHELELLKQMIRIRRFEDKCAELYTQEKIRGFLHLYDGEEAVAVGVMQSLEPGIASSRPIASTATRWCAASPWRRPWPRCMASERGAAAAAAARCICSIARPNFYGGNAIVGGGLPLAVGLALGRQDAGSGCRDRLLLRRRRGR